MSAAARAPRIGLGVVLVATMLTLLVGFAHKSLCLTGDRFDTQVYRVYCYTDYVPLYESRGLGRGDVPYLDARNEYPVGTALFMWIGARVGRDQGHYFLVNAVLLSGAALVTAWVLHRAVGPRALYFALAPPLALYAFLNWDLLPVALAAGSTLAFLRGRDGAAGALLGLGAATKLYPILLLLPFALERRREANPRGAARLAVWAAATWLVVNLPFMVLAFDRWSEVFRYSASRAVHWATLWYAACRAVTGDLECGFVRLVNLLSAVSFLVGAVWVWRAKVARQPDVPRWTLAFPLLIVFLLTSKVYSPQYSLWLVPWFALAMPDLRLFGAFVAVDVAAFATEFSWLERYFEGGGWPLWPLEVAVVARAIVLLAILVAFVRRPIGAHPVPSEAIGAAAA